MLQSNEIRERFLKFFEKRGHTIIPSASLIPENDPSVLFNTAGMQPLVPYLLGATHPTGATRLADSQKCVRTNDIDEVGDNTHATFFEMLGNWSLGDYFKEEAIKWSFEFLTSKEEGLGLDPHRLYVTVFGGNSDAEKDTEAYAIWEKLFKDSGVGGERIYYMVFADDGKKEPNWWSPGDNGPCGPDSEMFYDVTGKITEGMTKEEYMAADERQDVVEIWNDVFMEYEKKDGKVIGKLAKKNVDTGSGLERVTMVVQGKNNIFDTDLLAPIVSAIGEHAKQENSKAKRIIADHLRTSIFMIADGVTPSNTDRGYILRRLIRRAVRLSHTLELDRGLEMLVDDVVSIYKTAYPYLVSDTARIKEELKKEEEKFKVTLLHGMKEFEKLSKETITAKDAFDLYQTYGFPIEVTKDLAAEKGVTIDEKGFEEEMKKHQEISKAGSEQKFKGGLGDTSEISIRYHTATHLLHKALREVLGDTVFQKGSNITPERMRFDFSYGEKMTDEQKKKVEDLVNEKIKEALPVSYEDLPIEEARKRGAMGLFGDKYGDTVRVYTMGEGDGSTGLTAGKWSVEICGGPHVKNTSELGHFKIAKEEACSAGVRRIKAILD
jgi:alanyl-tRNA synthetase